MAERASFASYAGYAVLLTNRVHPTRHVETGIVDLRKAVGNRLAAALPF